MSVNLFEGVDGSRRRLGEELGATLWGATLYELRPGQESPYHWHFGEEEWVLVVAGSPTLRTPDGERVLRPWDLAVFRRGEEGAHQVRNDGQEPARLVFFSTVSDPDVTIYPDTDKVGVVAGHSRPDGPHIRGWVEPR